MISNSRARAKVHSRCTLRSEISRASAISPTERPLKIKCPKCGAKGTLKDEGPPPKTGGKKKDEEQVIDCPACGGAITVETKKRPLKIECPSCGKKGTLKK